MPAKPPWTASLATYERGRSAFAAKDTEPPVCRGVAILNQGTERGSTMSRLVTIDVEQMPLRVPADATTFEGFRAWATSEGFPERGRISYIQGELWIDLSPAESSQHQPLVAEVSGKLYALVRELDLGRFFADRTLISNPQAKLSTEPDASFATWDTLQSGRLRYLPMKSDPKLSVELEGTPDWVLEVVSVTSVVKDKRYLRRAYHAAGVPEYWLMDDLGEAVDFQMLVHRPEGYVPVAAQDGWLASEVFPRRFRLDRDRDRLGGWRYTLRVERL